MLKRLFSIKALIGFTIVFTTIALLVVAAVVAELFPPQAPLIWLASIIGLVVTASIGCVVLNLK